MFNEFGPLHPFSFFNDLKYQNMLQSVNNKQQDITFIRI